ncbi:MAG: hypothetical protein H7A01_08705 [Hahellaceae bacterium]|nr:hypothetical protein [Hahellaceae bacterium]MCP5211449.1 hypothetical protein [Hahellaceae bacterium]
MHESNQTKSYLGRMKAFMDIIYEPKLHFGFAAFWFLSLQGLMVLLAGQSQSAVADSGVIAWQWQPATLLGVVTLFLIMFFLRAVDEVKDYEYDVRHNPDRPLVSGAVSFADLRSYWLLAFLLIPLLNVAVSVWLALFVVLDMAYGLLLMKLEKWLPWMQKSMFFNLLLTYPVSIALSFYTLLLTLHSHNLAFDPVTLQLILIYILAFLHFEIVRKNLWPSMADPGERFYSHDIGPVPAALLGFSCGLVAVVMMLLLTEPWHQQGLAALTGWLPLLALIPCQKSLVKFLTHKRERYNPRKLAVLFLVIFYATNLLHALAANTLAF